MSSKISINAKKIIERLKKYLNIDSDYKLAMYLDVPQSTLASWISRDVIDFMRILEKIKDVDLNWLIKGDGYGYEHSEPIIEKLKENDNSIIYQLQSKIVGLENELKKNNIEISNYTKKLHNLSETDKSFDNEISSMKAKIEILTDLLVKFNAKPV